VKIKTLRGRVTLWSVAIVTIALVLFGAAAAWNLRHELFENLDHEIKAEASDFFTAIQQRGVDWSNPQSVEMLFAQSKRFPYVEIHDAAGRLLYRSQNLANQGVFPTEPRKKLHNLTWNGRTVRFGVFEAGGITLALGKETGETNETLADLIAGYLLALPLVVIAVGLGGWWIADRAVAPVKAIAAQAEKISASDLHQRLPQVTSNDEIDHLTRVLNAMFDRLQGSFEQVTRFTSDASHELKTPLALMRAEIESALESPESAPEQRELLSNLIEQCSRLSQIVDGLLFLSRADDRRLAIEQNRVDLVTLVRELIEDAEILATKGNVTLKYQLPTELLVHGDVRLLRRALMNLIDNAIKHNRPGGTVVLSASADEQNAVVTVRNTGPAILPEARERVFDRFYRYDLSHSGETAGHGLGLSIAREIAHAHSGEVTLVRSDSDETEFSIALPINAITALESADLNRIAALT
jgi:heavy metal sensor kinase